MFFSNFLVFHFNSLYHVLSYKILVGLINYLLHVFPTFLYNEKYIIDMSEKAVVLLLITYLKSLSLFGL